MTIRAEGFTKECVVRCANSGSLMMKGQEPSPPALAELRYPMTGGRYRVPTYGSELEMAHERVFPASYQLNELAQLWERTFPQHEAFEKDGLHPKGHFATYMIEIAMLEADLRCPAFRHTGRAADRYCPC